MIIDFHTHCFPDSIAEYAIGRLEGGAPNPAQYNGTESGLLDYMRLNGVDRSVVLNISTNAGQTANVNKFAVYLNHTKNLYAFGSVHPDNEDFAAQIDNLAAGGIKGIKMHPFYQDFVLDDDRMFNLYDYINKKRLIMIFHMGLDTAFNDDGRASPARLRNILNAFPDMTVIAAHMGGYGYIDDTFKFLAGNNVYLETSFGMQYFSCEQVRELLSCHDNSKILFGTDGPWNTVSSQIAAIRNKVADDVIYEKIMYRNALNLLGTK